MDCAVACLAMLLNLSYEEVLMCFDHNVMAYGATVRQVQLVAKKLNRPLRWTKKFDLEVVTGILGVRSAKWKSDHLVILKEGQVIDTDATLWDVDVFMAAYEATATSVLIEEEE